MTAPGTSFGATILSSPGYGLAQSCAWYQSKWFICAGFAKSAFAFGPVVCCCATHASHVAAIACWSAGTVAFGAAAAVGLCAAGTSAPHGGSSFRPAGSGGRVGTAGDGAEFGFVGEAPEIRGPP